MGVWPKVCIHPPKVSSEEKVNGKTAAHGTTWEFSPADSPHRQGVAEALIKSVKRCVKVFHGHPHRLSWQEYATVGYECADMLNSRPIGVHSARDDVIKVLTPNSLIIGRNSSNNPGCYIETTRTPRLCLVNGIVDKFWKTWMQVCRPAMLNQLKWYKKGRCPKIGDVVLITNNDPLDRQYQLAQITKAEPGKDGIVRTVDLKYKKYISSQKGIHSYTGGTDVTVKRSVQRLVLLVPIDEARTHQNDY